MVIRAQEGRAECCLNWNVSDISVNCEFKMICMQKMNVVAKISPYLALCRYTKTAQRIFNCSDI